MLVKKTVTLRTWFKQGFGWRLVRLIDAQRFDPSRKGMIIRIWSLNLRWNISTAAMHTDHAFEVACSCLGEIPPLI